MDKGKMHNIIEEIVPEVGAQIEGCESCDSSNPEGIFINSQMMEELSTYINLVNFPIKSCKSEHFEHVIQPSFQSGFRKKPLSLLIKRTMIAAYKRDKKSLKEYFVNFGGSVAVTADLWSSEWGERFVCVTCRWIDDDDGFWSVKNRVIGFRVIKDDATCNEICWEICNVLDVFKLWTKVFCISLGTGLNGDEYVESVTNRINPIERGIIFNVRSCAYAANLCAQRGMEELGCLINPIRELVRWTRTFRGCKDVFKTSCKAVGLKPRYFPLDWSRSWNSTYEMLCLIFPYKEILSNNYKDNVDQSLDLQWDVINSIIQLFKTFNDAIQAFSLVYDANCHQVVIKCVEIIHVFEMYENDPILGLVVGIMKNKWLEYMSDIPTIYCIAAILDPDIKVEGLSNLLDYYYKTLGVTYRVEEKVSECKDILKRLYTHYASIYKCKNVTTQPNSQSQMMSSEEDMEIDHSPRSKLLMKILKKPRASPSKTAQLDEYLFFRQFISRDESILQWWKKNDGVFSILSKVAKDILCIPTSMAALESTFSTGEGERVLDEQWLKFQPREIQACICKRDWDMAENRAQQLHLQQINNDDSWMMMDTSDSETEGTCMHKT